MSCWSTAGTFWTPKHVKRSALRALHLPCCSIVTAAGVLVRVPLQHLDTIPVSTPWQGNAELGSALQPPIILS